MKVQQDKHVKCLNVLLEGLEDRFVLLFCLTDKETKEGKETMLGMLKKHKRPAFLSYP